MLRVISADVFEAVGGRPVRCIGVAALTPSAWEVCGASWPSPAGRLTCGFSVHYPRVTVATRDCSSRRARNGHASAGGAAVIGGLPASWLVGRLFIAGPSRSAAAPRV
jgi:hypothetical protein